jgi:GTA TIM-barrel-like domain/Putative phage tail protein
MATLALGALGAAAGSALLPAGLSVLGATITGAAIGSQVGALAGSYIDQALFGATGRGRSVDGPRLSELHVTTSTEGAPIPRVYGRARIGGQIIWATNLEEHIESANASGTGGGKGARSSGSSGSNYTYYANIAVGLCEGPMTGLGRIWADGTELDLSKYTTRFYTGTETQLPDALIEAKQGTETPPAFRGLAYIVFERLPLAAFGNRIPQLSFEVIRAVDTLERDIRGVCLIPGSGEFVYAQEPVTRRIGRVQSASENVHTNLGTTDWSASLDQLQSTLPNAKSVSLIVSWFGSDLRAGLCQLRPCVDSPSKPTSPMSWSVAGLMRDNAHVVSSHDDKASYGGTPSDQTVIGAIRDLKDRGLSVTLSPFILMDIPSGNTLTDPYWGGTSQPAYPWRGRITCTPAAARPGTPDKTAAAAIDVQAFVGVAQTSHYAVVGDTVTYTGPNEWSFRRMILHHAYLAKAAGGVDAFVIGSELRGLTTIRDGAASYPFVTALIQLATDVKAILGPATKIVYAADWSEYFGHQPPDGSNDILFHLDPLWASPAIDAIGVDVYWPLADWRDGLSHADALTGTPAASDLAYLKSNLFGGEGFDWYYASATNRDAQIRSPIADYWGEPWIYRYKDIRSWWLSAHKNRIGGVIQPTATAWVPQSKPFWFMEIGCPAIDKGANEPNVFIDPKSSESFQPHYSNGTRDDFIQRRVLQAFFEAFDHTSTGYVAGANPPSTVYTGRMVDVRRIHVYAWDARPFPAFPNQTDVWSDGENWRLGHWINGRAASAPLPALVSTILTDHGFTQFDVSNLSGLVTGLVVDRIMSARDTLQALELAFFLDTTERDGKLVFRHRSHTTSAATLADQDMVESAASADLVRLTRGQDADLATSAKITYLAASGDYSQAVAEARRQSDATGRVSSAALPLVLTADQASAIAESWLFDTWASRERAAFTLPPSRLALEPGDAITFVAGGQSRLLRITEISDGNARDIEARTVDPAVYTAGPALPRPSGSSSLVLTGQALTVFLDLPLLHSSDLAYTGYVAATQIPWPGTIAIYRAPEQSGFALKATVPMPATLGVTLSHLPPGPEGRLDHATRITVELDRGELTATTELGLLGGANYCAIETAPDTWEVIQFRDARLVATGTYELSVLLRAQRGTESRLGLTVPAGARFVLLNDAITAVDMIRDDVGLAFNWKSGPTSRDIGHASYATAVHKYRGVGLLPFSPVHVRATRSQGHITLTWVRRTRIDGDSWDQPEVPLGEDNETYQIDILSGGAVARTLTTTAPTATYSTADQIADFGAVQPLVSVRVYQVSATLGRGSPRAAMV